MAAILSTASALGALGGGHHSQIGSANFVVAQFTPRVFCRHYRRPVLPHERPFFAYVALENETGRTSNLWIAGVFWAFAIGTRLSILGEVLFNAGAVVTTLIILLPAHSGLPKAQIYVTVLGIPLALCFLALGWYNVVRLGSPWESSLRYQLTWTNLNKNQQQLFALKYICPNLYNYTLLPVATDASYPFVRPRSPTFPPFFDPSQFDSYHAEDVTGLLMGAPFLLFALLPLVSLIHRPTGAANEVGTIKLEDSRRL